MWRKVNLARAPQTPGDSDGFFEDLNPAQWWAEIESLDPIVSDNTRVQSFRVRGRFHAGITVDTRLLYYDADQAKDREIFVKGVQAIDRTRMVLYCEEVVA